MYFDISTVGLCLGCGKISQQARKYQNKLLKHQAIEGKGEGTVTMWGCPLCRDKRYFILPRPIFAPAQDYVEALAEALATWPDERFYLLKRNVEQQEIKIGEW